MSEDVGHLLLGRNRDIADMHRDDEHEELGARWLAQLFEPAVTEPVRLHVSAKRYLCAVDDDYLERLSDASMHSLFHQGGPMSLVERRAFESSPWHAQALTLRRLDDRSRRPGGAVDPLAAYCELIAAQAIRTPG